MAAEGVGVNHDSPVPKSNKPPCDTAVTGQPDNATQRAKQIGLTHTGCLLLITPLAITKQMTVGPTGASDPLSWHIVIYIIVIYHVWCGSLIYWLVFGLCVMHAHLKTRGNCTPISQFMDHHTGFVAVNASEQQLWKIVQLREFAVSSSCSLLLCICAPLVF